MPIYTNEQFAVLNPNGCIEGIISIIEKTRDINVLSSALKNPKLTEEMISAVSSRVEFMSLQGCVTPSVKVGFYLDMISKTNNMEFLSSVLNGSDVTIEVLDAVSSRLEFLSLQGCVTPSDMANFSEEIKAKKVVLSRGR